MQAHVTLRERHSRHYQESAALRRTCNWTHPTRKVAVPKGGLALCDTHVGVQEDRRGAANHGTMYSAHNSYVQIANIDEALNSTPTQRE